MKFFIPLLALVAIAAARSPRVMPIVPLLDGRIVGGVATTVEEYPHQLSLQRYGSHSCGASILSPTRALTAAHCTSGASASSLSLRSGSSIRGSGGTVHQVSRICQHPKYSAWTIDYDVSVLIVSTPFSYGSGVQPIALVNSRPAAGTLATVSGWGTLCSSCSLPSQLQKVEVPVITQDKCKSQYGSSSITDRMVCCGYDEGGKDSCQGDSGGPLIAGGSQFGVVSWGAGCASPNKAGVYADVAESVIRSHIDQCQ